MPDNVSLEIQREMRLLKRILYLGRETKKKVNPYMTGGLLVNELLYKKSDDVFFCYLRLLIPYYKLGIAYYVGMNSCFALCYKYQAVSLISFHGIIYLTLPMELMFVSFLLAFSLLFTLGILSRHLFFYKIGIKMVFSLSN